MNMSEERVAHTLPSHHSTQPTDVVRAELIIFVLQHSFLRRIE